MKRSTIKRLAARRQQGAIGIMAAFSMILLIAIAGLAIDAGYLFYCQKRLQAATDAAALAGAADLWTSSFTTAQANAMAYTAGKGKNAMPSGVTVSGATITGLQLTNAQLPASGAVSKYNAIQVVQQAIVPLTFAGVFGFKSLAIAASSKAAAGGAGSPAKYNVMIVLDTTASMNNTDSNCPSASKKSLTRLQCAQQAALLLLQNLTNAGDNVGLMVFPPLAGSSKDTDFSCGSGQQGIASSYSAVGTGVVTSGATYQVTGPGSGYLKNGALNTGSSIVQALGGGSCSGIPAIGGLGTFYAQAIASAQAALQNMSQGQSPPGQNVIILLSDGDATSSQSQLGNTYKSTYGQECRAAVTSATTARQTGTLIYTVAYIGGGSTSASCSDGGSDLTPCTTMQQIASGPSYFFSDTCPNAAGGSINLNAAFSAISYSLTKPRLVPQNAT
ncbi:pilus assembly protein TadG-related protein [Ralstonia sp. ASV6]|uniref:pilus assembly protein TadG-related protein n=1 Tax=Ralstonia sp. ASV6 TaxID=2795124 RepID=UPI0018EC9732|nr:pilus assembly protein TadG-related protein [Ralstonia sp. ASV6]